MVKTAASHFLACHSVISSRAPLSRNRRNRPVVCFAGDVIASSGRFPGVRARKWCVFALKWPFPWGPCTKRACFCAQVAVSRGPCTKRACFCAQVAVSLGSVHEKGVFLRSSDRFAWFSPCETDETATWCVSRGLSGKRGDRRRPPHKGSSIA